MIQHCSRAFARRTQHVLRAPLRSHPRGTALQHAYPWIPKTCTATLRSRAWWLVLERWD